MSFYDDARNKAKARKQQTRSQQDIMETDKKGYSRDESQKYVPGKRKNRSRNTSTTNSAG